MKEAIANEHSLSYARRRPSLEDFGERLLTSELSSVHPMQFVGTEWLVDARGCDPHALADVERVRAVFERVVAELSLHVVGEALWHKFPEPGGLTGLALLSESHLACHTFPEFGIATFNLYCCRARPAWPWAERLREMLGAEQVEVRACERAPGAADARTNAGLERAGGAAAGEEATDEEAALEDVALPGALVEGSR